MSTLLITVRETMADEHGLRLTPGLYLAEMKKRPAIGAMMQGSPLELRLPDGTIVRTTLVTYGVSVMKREDGSLEMHGDPENPEICLTLPADLAADDVPPGTEVWLLEE